MTRARRIRTALVAATLGAAVSAAAAAAVQAATVTVDHPCYYSFGSTQEPVVLTAERFRPDVELTLMFPSGPFHTNRATDANGRLQARFPAPRLRGSRARVPLTVSDGTSSATTLFYLTNVTADFNPSSGAPSRLRVRFTVRGLGAVLAYLGRNPRATVFAHYIGPDGRLKGTRQFGHLQGPCGDLTTPRTRLLPYASKTGNWTIYFDTNRRYNKRERARVSVGFRIRTL